ncbi:unnamed protein product [Laminaria digitata]
MTIAGSDSGAGAGAQADLKTFAAHRVHGTSVLTLITAQNTVGVDLVHMLPVAVVRAQYEAVYSDLTPAAAKLGALGSEAMIGCVIELLQDYPIDALVVDPVMVTKHGEPLMSEATQRFLARNLLEHALLVTPNRHEAEAITGRGVDSPSSMKDAAKHIFDLGARNVLIKGSHLDRIVRDYFYDGTGFVEFGADRIDSRHVHGSGCVMSASITARLSHGDSLLAAIETTREFISNAIERAPRIGNGIAPVNPFHALWDS